MGNQKIAGMPCPSCDHMSLLEDEGTGVIFCGECKCIVYDGVSEKRTTYMIPQDIQRMWSGNTAMERNIRQSLEEIYGLQNVLSLDGMLLERAARLFVHAMGMRMSQGRPTRELAAACLYAACRITKTPRTLTDISKNMSIRQKNVARCYRTLYRRMDLKMPVADPDQRIRHIASKADLGADVQDRALTLAAQAKSLGLLDGRDPAGMAAATLYLASVDLGRPTSQKEISQASGITEVTIRKNYSLLIDLSSDSTSEQTHINRSMIRPGRRRSVSGMQSLSAYTKA